jgi:protein phosphatase
MLAAVLKVRSATSTHQGKRHEQEDAFLADDDSAIFAVADGMGAATSGRPAADLAIAMLRQRLDVASAPAEARLIGAVRAANEAIFARADDAAHHWEERKQGRGEPRPELARWLGMGTTLVALWFTEGRAFIAHVGDSRAYFCRYGVLLQLTTDHRLTEDARRAGMPEEEIAALPARVITRALGMRAQVEIESLHADVAPGDLFLVASDGLTDALSQDEIEALLRKHRDDPAAAAGALVEAAVARGERTSWDNITVIVVSVE